MTKALAALAALAGLAHAGSAAAATQFLLSGTAVTPPPPLQAARTPVAGQTEVQIPGHIAGRQLVEVGVGPDGAPVTIIANQRMRIEAPGDYSFVVPGPVTRLAPGPGTESLPGLRDVGIVWQGFSDGDRVLSAVATLRPEEAAEALPLRVRLEPRGDATVVRLENLTGRSVSIVDGRATRAAVLTALRRLHAKSEPTRIRGGPGYINGEASKGLQVDVSAPLHVTGVISGGPAPVTVDEQLGGDRPVERTFDIAGTAAPKLRLRVELLPPIEILPTAAEIARARRPLIALQSAIGEISLTGLYRTFLATPDPAGTNEASYVYRSVPKPAAVAARTRDEDSDTLAIVLGVVLGAAALTGLAVLWARS